jgi:hypothetical protein
MSLDKVSNSVSIIRALDSFDKQEVLVLDLALKGRKEEDFELIAKLMEKLLVLKEEHKIAKSDLDLAYDSMQKQDWNSVFS